MCWLVSVLTCYGGVFVNQKIENLYDVYHMRRAEGAEGNLVIYHYDTPVQLGDGRLRPAVLILPGGAYRWTSDRESEPVALRFAAMGYIPFVLKYSCAPFTFPTALRECAMAMRFIRENSSALNVNENMIAALGFSAGGHLCGTLGTMWDSSVLSDIADPQTVKPDILALCYPVAISSGRTHLESFRNLTGGDSELADKLSLDKLVREDMPPVFLWHTRNDESVPCRNSIVLANALDEKGVDFSLHIYAKGRHGLSTGDSCTNRSWDLPDVSGDVTSWIISAMMFFEEHGFRIIDKRNNI